MSWKLLHVNGTSLGDHMEGKADLLREGIERDMKIDGPRKRSNTSKFSKVKGNNSHKQVQETWSDYGRLKGWHDVSYEPGFFEKWISEEPLQM